MHIILSPETQKLLEERMRKGGHPTADDALRVALQTLDDVEGAALEDLDEETRAAIERAEEQADRGEGCPWEEVREELRERYLRRP
jgi:Arc/MetJ-type ribon-helix-helix transcriptional regulator